MSLRPIGAMVLLKPVAYESQTSSGGVLIAKSLDEGAQEAKVIAIGVRVENVEPGQIVLFDQRSHSLSNCRVEGESMVLIGEHDLLAIVESD
mgnify:CR=1 FL=1